MKKELFNPVIIGKPLPAIKVTRPERASDKVDMVIPPIDPTEVLKVYSKTPAGKVVADKFPDILDPVRPPRPLAGFRVCGKSGLAKWLDIWDCDHFDLATDMGLNLSQCRVWFSSNESANYGSGLTKTGRINCTFDVPDERMYRCDATLQSSGGTATVECLLDNSTFGTLTVNGTITQPHYRDLSAGRHQFRIEQRTGSFYFLSLMVYAM